MSNDKKHMRCHAIWEAWVLCHDVFFTTRAESGGGEKPCGVMTMSHHCHNVQCLVSTPVMSIVHCPVVIVSVIESSQGQDSAADYEERVSFKHTLPLDLWLLSSTVVSNVLSSILHCPIKILSIERVVHPSTWLQPQNVYNRQRT